MNVADAVVDVVVAMNAISYLPMSLVVLASVRLAIETHRAAVISVMKCESYCECCCQTQVRIAFAIASSRAVVVTIAPFGSASELSL